MLRHSLLIKTFDGAFTITMSANMMLVGCGIEFNAVSIAAVPKIHKFMLVAALVSPAKYFCKLDNRTHEFHAWHACFSVLCGETSICELLQNVRMLSRFSKQVVKPVVKALFLTVIDVANDLSQPLRVLRNFHGRGKQVPNVHIPSFTKRQTPNEHAMESISL